MTLSRVGIARSWRGTGETIVFTGRTDLLSVGPTAFDRTIVWVLRHGQGAKGGLTNTPSVSLGAA